MGIKPPCLHWIPLMSHSHHAAQINYQTAPNAMPSRDAVPPAWWRKPLSCCGAAHIMPSASKTTQETFRFK